MSDLRWTESVREDIMRLSLPIVMKQRDEAIEKLDMMNRALTTALYERDALRAELVALQVRERKMLEAMGAEFYPADDFYRPIPRCPHCHREDGVDYDDGKRHADWCYRGAFFAAIASPVPIASEEK